MTKSKRYNYSCAGCDGRVEKPPVAMSANGESMVHGLHGWTCENCGTGIKIKREMK